LELKKGKSALMSSEKWKPFGVVTNNAVDCADWGPKAAESSVEHVWDYSTTKARSGGFR